MTGEHDVHVFLLVQDVENLQYDAAGQGKERLDPFPLEALQEYFRPGEFHLKALSLQTGPAEGSPVDGRHPVNRSNLAEKTKQKGF